MGAESQKLTSELPELHSEIETDMLTLCSDMQKDMESLISSIKDSLNLLLEMKNSWEQSLKECNIL